ncbi:MAG: hypothetical protein C4298_06150, partial [Thermus sp.]
MNRAADVAIAGLGLVLASPVLALAALAIKLEDGGPILYRQRRVGKDGVEFELLKLRTMVMGAESQGAGWAVDEGDPRITRVGRVLRRLSLDELPPVLLRAVGLTTAQGAMVDRVEPGGPAARAGLRGAQRDTQGRLVELGDVILAVNGRPVRSGLLAVALERPYTGRLPP